MIIKKIYVFLLLLTAQTFYAADAQKTFLVFGGEKGWIGQQIITTLKEQGYIALASKSRLENRTAIEQEIATIKPDFIINAAGILGVPNVDWCESHKQETIRSNVIGAINLADIAYLHKIHFTNIGTGCIYEYDSAHPMYSGIGFTEEEEPNFKASFYSYSKVMFEKLLSTYPNALNLRLRMPISDDLHPRNFITKISKYSKVINIPNSLSVLSDLLPLISQMAERGLTGNYNFVNPGVMSHNEVLDLYKEYVDPNFKYSNFTLEEQNNVLKAPRSNTHLDTSKLLKEFPNIPDIKTSIIGVFKKIKNLR